MSPRRAVPRDQPDKDDTVEGLVELTVVARQAGLTVSVVRRYLMLGLIEPQAEADSAPLFDPSSAARVAKADRLRRDLDLNAAGAVLACELLDRIRELEVLHAGTRGRRR
jgi:DNA-binding transcriptional MerR regulator